MQEEDNKKLLQGFGSSGDATGRVLPNASGSQGNKRRNIFIGAGIAVVVLIVIIIILASGGSDPEPSPTPPGPTPVPPIPGGYNPYRVDEASVNDEEFQVSALLQYAPPSEVDSNRTPAAGKKPAIINPQDIPLGTNNQAIQKARLTVGQVDYTVARLIISDDDSDRFSPPEWVVGAAPFQSQLRLDMCGFDLNLEPFSFSFSDKRQPDSPTLLSTKDQSFAFYDKYMQLDMKLFSQRIYGLGERNREFTLGEGTWTMWAHGRETPYDDGSGGKQTYGVHPFALVQTATPGEYMGLYFRNTNAQSPVLKHNDDGTSVLSYITVGGQIDVFFFFKGTAKQIINQYQGLVGRPNLPPFWAYGWHSASYAYKNQSDVQAMVDGYAQADMPLEGVWIDIPEMDNFQDFTINKTAFPDLPGFTATLHSAGQKLVVIVDAGLSADDLSNKYFAQAFDQDLLLKSSISDEMDGVLTAKVWPNKTVFLDWFNPKSAEVWAQGLSDFYKEAPYDGLWLDMNEVTTFCDGECPNGGHSSNSSTDNSTQWYLSFPQDENSTYFLPFIPGQHNLDFMTISLNGTHPSTNYSQFDTHSLFGLMEAAATRNFLIGDDRSPHKGNRSFTLSRSTFAGSGVHTTHWLGDNHREWAYLNYSISGMMNFNMFGIPFVGPDTCGFFKSRYAADLQDEQQLCGRWMQLATFQPFGRLHRDKDDSDGGRGGNRTEPYLLEEPFQSWSRNALYNRLQFLRQLYTCHYSASRDGDTCFDPLLFHFPLDDGTFNETEHSFIYANALKVSPVLQPNVTSLSSYFPAGHWVSMNNMSEVVKVDCPTNHSDCFGVYGEWRDLPVSNDSDSQIHSHLMPGAMLAFQNNSQKFKLTSEIMAQDVTMIANRDHNGQASGKLFLDDGISLEQLYETNSYEYYSFQLSAGSIKKWILNEDSRAQPSGIKIDKFVIADAPDLNETDFACLLKDSIYSMQPLKADFDSSSQTLTFSQTDGSPIDPFTMKDIFYGNSKKDVNLCDFAGSLNYYHTADFAQVDLSANQTEVILVNSNPVYANLSLQLKVFENGAVNVFWNYQDPSQAAKEPFQVPTDVIAPGNSSLANASLSAFVKLQQNPDQPMQLSITNKAGEEVYRLNGMTLATYLNVISGVAVTKAGSPGIMGLFERISTNLFLPDGVFSLYSRDVPDPIEDGKPPGKNLYGTHPVFMAQATDDSWFGLYTNLAQAQDWWVKNSASGEINVTSIAVGGLGDLYFFFGEDPNQLVTAYHNLTGKPVLTPQWALGWNQCRWGYHNTSETRAVVEAYRENDLPLDTMWNDIDYLDRYEDFTEDPKYFADLKDLVSELHANDTHYIPILDIGIAERASGYDAYSKGLDLGVYVTAPNGDPFTGRVWPGDTVYPDFFAENTAQWWKDQLSALQELIPFDGLWEDMNEASNFCDGVCYRQQEAASPVKFKLPYVPTGRDLEIKSMSLDAQHARNLTELDTHSLIGTQEVKVTHDWFLENKKRPMIIERSSFAGMGKFGSRWMGDNSATEEYMGLSVTGVQAHNIMGIPLVGADICGFIGDTNPELCARWHVVGAFYPFSRNHNDRDSMSQEPYVFTDIYQGSTSYLDIMRYAIKTKYSMVRYYYTQLSLLSIHGGAFYKPLFFEFPSDPEAFKDQHRNVMLGAALKLSVLSDVLDQNQTDFYFPQGDWCDLYRKGLADQSCFTSAGAPKTLDTFAYSFYVHLRAGHIVPFQDTNAFNFSTTTDLQKQPVDFYIHAACDANANCSATGAYLNDDGLTTELQGYQNVFDLELQTMAGAQVLNFTAIAEATQLPQSKVNENDMLGQIHFFNAKKQGLDSNHTVSAIMTDGSQKQFDVATYDVESDRLIAKNMNQQMGEVSAIIFAKQ